MSLYEKNAANQASRTSGGGGAGVCSVPPRASDCLDQRLCSAANMLELLRELKATTALIRGQLLGPWPENPSKQCDECGTGIIDAVRVQQNLAFDEIAGIRDNLAAIHQAVN